MPVTAEVADIAHHFLNGICIGIPAFFISAILRSFIDSLGLTRVTMLITLCTVPFNIFLNYCFIFGNFGFRKWVVLVVVMQQGLRIGSLF